LTKVFDYIGGKEGLVKDVSEFADKYLTGVDYSGPGIPQYASGTTFHPGGPAIVGEQGLEVIDLHRGASVTPIMGGNNIGTSIGNQNIHINVTGGWDAREMANKIVRELRFLGISI